MGLIENKNQSTVLSKIVQEQNNKGDVSQYLTQRKRYK